MEKKIVSVHQPNLFPRRSFFEKIEQSDLFVIMGQCQYTTGGFQNRFNVGDRFYSMAVYKGKELISAKLYKNCQRDAVKIFKHFPKLETFHECFNMSLLATNSHIITKACYEFLNIETEIVWDRPTTLTGTERLVDICKTHNATHYLSGISGRNYLKLELFDSAGIEVIFQDENKMDKRPLVECL